MTKREVEGSYLEWMYQIICDGGPSKGRSYDHLLRCLHDTDFTYTIPMDGNRAEDGVDLRYRYGYEMGCNGAVISRYLDDRPCSVLEMMVALCIRCEEHIMDDPDIGDRTGRWFWDMIRSLGLEEMDDERFDERYVRECVSRFLRRRYRKDGKGGLFTIREGKRDMRSVEIWYQMCWYLDEIL